MVNFGSPGALGRIEPLGAVPDRAGSKTALDDAAAMRTTCVPTGKYSLLKIRPPAAGDVGVCEAREWWWIGAGGPPFASGGGVKVRLRFAVTNLTHFRPHVFV